ncbi:uncharacterized protein TM35_000063600 [Trypanosoma theileri]|uniref:Uncharacterized protein n=1 Tax=Trypanosoma theileri TaxID=67003 RepID=A0A1X0P393_9TRYP|nr:uncharacterized protein TM35_000063600 [Trypanosoma theileri]ORC91355.1 hypothetical protein TM35_000063600 [Trypanosoma theileri]
MPAKKRTGVSEAERAEAARQAELRRLAEEQERLRKLESEARQRLEEEWTRSMDAHRQRQMDIQRAITERELRLSFEVREQEFRDGLERRECEVRELRAKLNGLQQGVNTIQQERDSALRRLAMVNNELELAQMKQVEMETLMDEKDREARARLRQVEQQRDESVETQHQLKVDLECLKRSYEETEQQLTSLQATFAGSPDTQLVSVHPQSTDAETALLLKVLNEEVEKHRETARLLQAELERKGRDDEKGSVLISLLNSQLEAARDECKRLHNTATDRRNQLEAVQALLDSEREKTKSLYHDLDLAHAESTVERRQLTLEIGVHTAQVEELTKTLASVNTELAEVKEQLDSLRTKSMEREQYDFQVNVALKGEVEQLKKDLAKTTEELRVAGDEAYTTKALLRAEIESLKTRLRKLQESSEKNERESFETIAVLRATTERLQEEKKTLQQTTEENSRKMRDELMSVCAARDGFRTQAEELKKEKEKLEKDLMEKLLRMTANHDHLHEELQRVTVKYAGREKEFVENSIFLNAEKETLKAKVEDLTEKLSQRGREHVQHVQEISNELMELKTKAEKQLKTLQKSHDAETKRAEDAENEVQSLKHNVADLEKQLTMRRRERDEMEKALKCEARELRLELNAAKRTIERFECALGDSSYKSLREANDELRRDLQQQREKVVLLNDTIASMKVESNIMESYKEKMLADQNEQYARRIQQQEKMRQLMNPLFYELRSIVEKNGLAGPLRRDLDAYDDYIRRSRPPAPPEKRSGLNRANADKIQNAPAAVAETQSPAAAAAAAAAVLVGTNKTDVKSSHSATEDGYPTLPAVQGANTTGNSGVDSVRFLPQKPATVQPQAHTPNLLPNIY